MQEELPYVERAVARKVVHSQYNFFTYEYDLALVKLDAPLEFAAHIAPICLPATNDLLIGRNATGERALQWFLYDNLFIYVSLLLLHLVILMNNHHFLDVCVSDFAQLLDGDG